jgi:hypothetical protein
MCQAADLLPLHRSPLAAGMPAACSNSVMPVTPHAMHPPTSSHTHTLPSPSLHQEHQGKHWDFVFDVEMDDGQKRKLAVNRGENPYVAARRFLEDEELPPYFTEQIVQFILQSTGQAGAQPAGLTSAPVTGGFLDPYTGGGGSSSAPPAAAPPQRFTQPATFSPTTGDKCYKHLALLMLQCAEG